jgi:ribonuclease VapC
VLAAKLADRAKYLMPDILERLDIRPVPFGERHWRAAFDAALRYGKGRHPAALNFGDCMTYAVAKLAGRPLLCIGDDFSKTDLGIA